MNLTKSTRYALHAVMELARHETVCPVTATQVAERYGIPGSVLAKVFQRLVHVGVAVSLRGTRGGYVLARHPSQVSLLDVIEAFEAPRGLQQCLLSEGRSAACPEPGDCRLRRLFDEVDETARATLASVSFETLLGDRLRRLPVVKLAP